MYVADGLAAIADCQYAWSTKTVPKFPMMLMMPNSRPGWPAEIERQNRKGGEARRALFIVSIVPSGWLPARGTTPLITLRLSHTALGEPSVSVEARHVSFPISQARNHPTQV